MTKKNMNGFEYESPSKYNGKYDTKITSKLEKADNAPAFNYDMNKDQSYKALQKSAQENGRLAMKDTLGEAAALSGGRNNSWATTAAAGAYNRYMGDLNDKIPALQQAAHDRYRYERERDQKSLENWMNQGNDDYQKYLDWAGIEDGQNKFTRGMYEFDQDFGEGKRRYDQDFGENKRRYDQDYGEGKRRYDQDFGEDKRRDDRNFNENKSQSTIKNNQTSASQKADEKQFLLNMKAQFQMRGQAVPQWLDEEIRRLK